MKDDTHSSTYRNELINKIFGLVVSLNTKLTNTLVKPLISVGVAVFPGKSRTTSYFVGEM